MNLETMGLYVALAFIAIMVPVFLYLLYQTYKLIYEDLTKRFRR